MANDLPNHQRCIVVPRPHFINLSHPPPPPPPIGFYPGAFSIFNPQVEFFLPPLVEYTLIPTNFITMDDQRTQSLLQFMITQGLVPTPEDDKKRKDAIQTLKQIVLEWIQRVAWQRKYLRDHLNEISATILTYGSYGLGAHGSDSDIDALCVGPCFANMGVDFFVNLCSMLQNRPEISELHCVKDAKVPLMRFKFNGISIDLPYAQLKVSSVPDNVDILDPFFSREIDEISKKSLSGVRANMRVLQLVPNVEKFQSLVRCLKFWAKRRGVYGNLVGYLGGIHIVVLAAYVCKRHPDASLSFLVAAFFETFGLWPWPAPVILEEGPVPVNGELSEARPFMPIQLPCSPDEYCHSNITKSTFHRIRSEFRRGTAIMREIQSADFEWRTLFDCFPHSRKYKHFVRILLAASNQDELGDWVGWVKSRLRGLLLKLEEAQGLCDPNPTEYVDPEIEAPHKVFFWGLQPGRTNFRNVRLVQEGFEKQMVGGYQGNVGTIKLSVVDARELPKNAQCESGSGDTPKAYWRIYDYNMVHRRPVYSYYMPNYPVGYVASGGAYPSSEG